MIYYFVDGDGEYLHLEEAPKGFFQEWQKAFTRKADAVAEQKRRLKERIKHLQECLEELK